MSETRQEALDRMDRERQEKNREVRARAECIGCDTPVPDGEYGGKYWSKFMAAGGYLHGPFCSRGCYWGELFAESQ